MRAQQIDRPSAPPSGDAARSGGAATIEQIDLPVLGMTCAACVRRVEKAALGVAGVTRADVNLALSRARLELDASVTTAARAATAIRAAGYDVPADVLDGAKGGRARLAAIEEATHRERTGLVRDAILAIVLAAALMPIAMVHGALAATTSVVVQLVLGTLVMLGPGRRYVVAGLAAVRHLAPDMNTLIALGAGAAWLASTIGAVRWLAATPRGPLPMLYFEAAAAIVAFVMIGKLLEARARSRLADAVRGLVSLAPATAHALVPASASAPASREDAASVERDVDAASLVAGDVILVRPGERVPADGTVIAGASALDESMLTGEALPVDKEEGSPVYAGTLNHTGALTVRVARAGADTSLARIARAVEDAQGEKAPIARLADRVSAYFVPAVLAIAALTFVGWIASGATASTALERMIAVLVIACPCALGLATPAAVAVGTARGAELGILYRTGAALEAGSAIDVVCLDKTGTLTTGAPTVVGLVATGVTEDELLRIAASAEQGSEHPYARAIVAAARSRALALSRPLDVAAEPGAGITANVDGHAVRIGARDRMLLAGIAPTALDALDYPGPSPVSGGVRYPGPSPVSGGVRYPGPSPVSGGVAPFSAAYVSVDGELVGLIALADPPAPGAGRAVRALREMGIVPVMISGDRDEVARAVAAEVGIERVHAGVRPTGKAAIVAAERQGGRRVAMVGDGINDAPALAVADLGIALGSGTDVAAAAADVTLLRGGIGALPAALALARATLRTIRGNLIAAFAYNVVCIPVAAFAPLSPMLAAAAMSLSSVTVLAVSLRLRSFDP
jgi:Cu+-exporting ATPase